MAKYIHLLRIASFNDSTQRFEFYRNEAFTSKQRVNKAVENMIECNNGYNITIEEIKYSGKPKETHITYSCMSAPNEDGSQRPMRIRYVVEKLALNYGY